MSRQSPEFTEQKILGDIVEGSGYNASVSVPLSSGVFSSVLLICLSTHTHTHTHTHTGVHVQ